MSYRACQGWQEEARDALSSCYPTLYLLDTPLSLLPATGCYSQESRHYGRRFVGVFVGVGFRFAFALAVRTFAAAFDAFVALALRCLGSDRPCKDFLSVVAFREKILTGNPGRD